MKIDLKRSIDNRRLIEVDITTERRFKIVFSYFLGCTLAFIPLLFSMKILTSTRVSGIGVVLFGAFLFIIGLIFLYGVLFKNRLLKINGTIDPEVNKSLMKAALKEVFRKNTFVDTGNIWMSRRFDKISVGGDRYNRLTVIFNNNSIYCNGAVIVRNDLDSTLHSLYYLLKFLRVRKRFDSRLADLTRQKSNYA
jgi:ABC-type transport system involved in multi-copper enzyme maturation permease subunit